MLAKQMCNEISRTSYPVIEGSKGWSSSVNQFVNIRASQPRRRQRIDELWPCACHKDTILLESHPRLTQTESKARRLDLSSCPGVDTHENLCREQREKVVSADMIMGGVESASKTDVQ